MLAMSPGVAMETSTQGGVLKGLRRSVLGGESFFMNTFTAQVDGAELWLAPALAGDVVAWPIQRHARTSSPARSSRPRRASRWTRSGAARRRSSRARACSCCASAARATCVLSSYGAIHAIDLQPGQTYTVDTGHMVAWTEGVNYAVRKVGNWKSTFFSGEGFVVDADRPGPDLHPDPQPGRVPGLADPEPAAEQQQLSLRLGRGLLLVEARVAQEVLRHQAGRLLRLAGRLRVPSGPRRGPRTGRPCASPGATTRPSSAGVRRCTGAAGSARASSAACSRSASRSSSRVVERAR